MKIKLKVLATFSVLLLLAGCLERSVSGTYVSSQSSSAELLQLTQTKDQQLVGTIQRATLTPDGRIVNTTTNVAGVVDGENLTLTIFNALLQIGDNFGGAVTSSGLDITVPASSGSTKTGTVRFDRGTLGDYNAAVGKLTEAGAVIQANNQHNRRVEVLNREANLLTQGLKDFVIRAQRMIEQQPHIIEYYTKAVSTEQARLDLAQHLATGNDRQQGQAQALIGQINASEANILNASDGVDQAHQEILEREARLNAGIQRFTGICLGSTNTVKPGDAIPSMGPCRSLISAVADYKAALGRLHSTRSTVLQAKATGLKQLNEIWRVASSME